MEDLPRYCNTVSVEVECDYCGKPHSKKWAKFQRGREIIQKDACSKCVPQKQKDICLMKNGVEHYTQLEEVKVKLADRKRKHTIEEVYNLFKEAGYELITKIYYNNEQLLQYICLKHGLKEISLGHFLEGKRCKECFYENNTGENNNMWKGGITPLNNYLRTKLYFWKKEIKENNPNCYITGEIAEVCHHLYPFYKIVEKTLKELNLDYEYNNYEIGDFDEVTLDKITERFLKNHKKYGLGICLKKEIHKLFHYIYGFEDIGIDKLNEFKIKYKNNEFDNVDMGLYIYSNQ